MEKASVLCLVGGVGGAFLVWLFGDLIEKPVEPASYYFPAAIAAIGVVCGAISLGRR